jgi:hypothetical protein
MFMRLNCAWWELGSSRMWQMMVKNRGIRRNGNWWWEGGGTMMNWPIIRAGGGAVYLATMSVSRLILRQW